MSQDKQLTDEMTTITRQLSAACGESPKMFRALTTDVFSSMVHKHIPSH